MRYFSGLVCNLILAISICGISNSFADQFRIGIAGGSRSGKTTVAAALAIEIPKQKRGTVAVLPQDNYYNPSAQPEVHFVQYSYLDVFGIYPNFDHPTALDWDLFKNHLENLSNGKPIRSPKYYFGTGGKRDLDAGEEIHQQDFVIAEGIFVLNNDFKDFFHLRVFVSTPEDVRKERVYKAGAERKQSKQDTDSYLPILMAAHQDHVAPTQDNADLIIDGTAATDTNIALILEKIDALLSK